MHHSRFAFFSDKISSLLGLFFLLSYTACSQPQNSATITAADYLKLLAETSNEYLIDVRTPEEFKEGHLNNAVNINIYDKNFEQVISRLDKSRPIFVYCLSGSRSADAMNRITKQGFPKVYNMQGGILQWKAKNYPLSNQSDPAAQTWKGMTKEEFNKIINDKLPVLVDFKAAWCAPCKMLKPVLDEIQQEYAGKIKIVEIDIDQHKSLADLMQIRNIPLMVYYKQGKVAMNIEGFADKAQIVKTLKLKK
jgi:Rhodanese-related sulfurtransferase